MSRILSILVIACFLSISPASAYLDMQSNAILFDGAGHGDQVRTGIIELIDNTECELLCQMYNFNGHEAVKPIFQAIERARARGVTVKIYLSREGTNNPEHENGFPEPRMEGQGVEVHWKRTGQDMHRKLWLSDCCTIFIGSSNISNNSFNGNDEIDLRIQDNEIAHKIKKVFDEDWQKSCENFDCIDQ